MTPFRSIRNSGITFLDVVRDEHLVVVQLDLAFRGLVLVVDLREVQDALQVEGVVHVQVDPEQRLLVVQEDLAVEFLVLLFRALVRMLRPERVNVVHHLRALHDLVLLPSPGRHHRLLGAVFLFLLLGLRRLHDRLHDGVVLQLVLLDLLRLVLQSSFSKIDRDRHEGAVLVQDLSRPVLIGEFGAVVIQIKRHSGAALLPVAVPHLKFHAAVGFPVHRDGLRLVGQGIDGHPVRHHEGGVEAQAEVADDLVVVRLVLVLLQEILRAGEGDLVDVLIHLIRRHADAVVREADGLPRPR